MPTALIIGGSVAGTRVALDLRRLGFTGEIAIVDEQLEPPYDRPPLSKGVLTSADGAPSLLLTRERAVTQGICLRLGSRAVRLDVAGKAVVAGDGTRLGYDYLVVATGARPRPLPWPAHDRLLELRTLADGRRLRRALRGSGKIAVVGAGFIGAEVASAARGLGVEVVMIDPLLVPMSRLLGTEVGSRFAALHAARGVKTRFGTGVDEIACDADGVILRLTDGDMLTADAAVAGIGAQPADDWLASSGLPVDGGLICDSRCRVLDHDDIYAAGDIARWFHPRHRELVRVEHWTNAVEQAQFVARQIVSPSADEFTPVEYVWSDQYDWKIQIAGRPERGTAHHLIDQPDRNRFCALYVAGDGALTGMITVNWPKAAILGRRALAMDLSPSGLRDQITRI
jgi:3-phenylpropionate/trans-cinnamate dioxygenase ferredoxin reductase component